MQNSIKDLTIIIVCYKSYKLILSNLEMLKNFKTILVDNSNCKKTFELVKNLANITYIKTSKNLGYGCANNIGIRSANTEYVLILNPDIKINEDSINILYEKINKYNNFGILAPSLYDENNFQRTNGSNSILKRNKSKMKNKQYILPAGDTCFDYVIGCAILIQKKFFIDIGCFDEHFFMYFEDNDLCDRVYSNNRTVIEIPSSKMIHKQGVSSELNLLSIIRLSIIHKISECIYLKKNLSKVNLITNLTIQFLDYFQRIFFNLMFFKLKKSFKNLFRLISIFLFVTSLYKLIY